jgi:lantibiotic transport system permease protein
MIALLRAEFRKLGGSLALLLLVLGPALPGLLAGLALLRAERTSSWNQVVSQFVLPIWVLFLFPMLAAAFATLAAQIEHKARGWDHLLALPIARRQVFAAKALVVLAALAAMWALMLGFTLAGAWVGGTAGGRLPSGSIPWTTLLVRVPLILLTAGPLIALQLWAALRFASFVVPLAVGIGGTLVTMAVAITGTDQADAWPWVLPFRALQSRDPGLLATQAGLVAAALLLAMLVDLSRREFL